MFSFIKIVNNFCIMYRVLLRVRMLYYIKHEIIGDLVQHISDGVHVRLVILYMRVYIYTFYIYIYKLNFINKYNCK